MAFADAHCHLGSRQFDQDRSEMIARMLAKDVRKAIIICCSEHELARGKALRDIYPDFKLAISIHPQDLEEDHDEQRLIDLKAAVLASKADMIGETGLDYYSHPHTREYQQHFFRAQLEMAAELHLPVDIHSRRATRDTIDILKQYPVTGIIHSYSGSVETAREFVKMGYSISFGASVLFPGSRKPAMVIAAMPTDRLLIETDAPFQSPVMNHRHEPADIVAIYEAIARIRGISLAELERSVEDNFDRVFTQ